MSHPREHHDSAKKHGHTGDGSKKFGIHKDWRLWVGVLLMLGAMLVYVLTLDESDVPAGNSPRVPAADTAVE